MTDRVQLIGKAQTKSTYGKSQS